MNIRKNFWNKDNIYNILFGILGIYLIIYALIMFIMGGEMKIFLGSAALILVFVEIIIFKIFGKFNTEIKQITIANDKIIFKHIVKNKLNIKEFSLDGLKIKADIYPDIYQYNQRMSFPMIFLVLTIEESDGTLNVIEDRSDDIDHSLKLLKFLHSIEIFSYNTDANVIQKLNDAVINYIEQGVYNKKVFQYYKRIICYIIGTIGVLFLVLFGLLIFTVFGFDL